MTILCRVTADPPNIQFEWTFSSSGERFEVPPGQYTTVQDSGSSYGGGGGPGYDKGSTYVGQGISSHTEVNGRSHSVETVSELLYTPKNERDFGTLACWAKNSIGKQTEPCLFQVVPAGELDLLL